MPSSSPEERVLQARMAAYTMHSVHDPRETTKPGRAAFLRKFEDQVDPGRILPEEERARRALAAKRAYFTGLSLKSARARRGKGGDAA